MVEFLEDNAVEVVPSNWLIEEGKKCLWPNKFKGHKLNIAVKNAIIHSNEFRARKQFTRGNMTPKRGKCLTNKSIVDH